MVKYLAAISTLLLMAVILSRVLMLKRRGIRALVFAETHRTDLLLPPFGLLLFILSSPMLSAGRVLAAAIGSPCRFLPGAA